MKSINQIARFSMILLGGLLLLFCCEPDLEPENPNNPNNPNPNINIDPDKASGYLVMNGASKISGPLPAATDGQLKIDVEDTAYAMLGYPIAAPNMSVKHPVGMDVASFNVMVNGASFYYQVPAEEQPAEVPPQSDSLTVLILDLQPPGNVALPYTIEVIIQVVDYSGKVIDQFNKWVTVEDPEDESCSPLDAHPCPDLSGLPGVAIKNEFCTNWPAGWRWQLTIQQSDGYVYRQAVPRWSAPWLTGGCCINGNSYFSYEIGSLCNPASESYKELKVLITNHTRHWQQLYLYDNGDFYLHHTAALTNIDPVATDFCSEEVWILPSLAGGTRGGTHDYTPGADYINLTYDPNKAEHSAVGDFYSGGLMVYTCHIMILVIPDPEGEGLGGEQTHLFLRDKDIENNPLVRIFYD